MAPANLVCSFTSIFRSTSYHSRLSLLCHPLLHLALLSLALHWQAIKQGLSHVQVSDASSNDEDDDDHQSDGGGDESDGYGDEGLSWEAVMQGLQSSKAGK